MKKITTRQSEEQNTAMALDEEEKDSTVKTNAKTKSVLVPRIQNMDDYFLKHYKKYVIQELNQCLVDGKIENLVGIPVKSDRILAGECCFQHFDYWRLNRTDFWIEIDLRLELRVQTACGIDTDFYWLYVELWFSYADDDEQCCFETLGRLENKREFPDCWKLDKYLVPVLRRDEIDKYSEQIWDQVFPEAAKEPKLRRANDLAVKLGLSIRYLHLYNQNHIRSVIFFRDSTVLTQALHQSGVREAPPPIECDVGANTIILNSNLEEGCDHDLDIYHECIHYEWHYLFYRLQDMYNNDMKQIKMIKRTLIKERDIANPVEFMEHQARYGSYGVMMPITFMHNTISARYKEVLETKREDGTFDHDGRRYDSIARGIASDYSLSKARVRARMLQLGYSAAKGALNYVDGRYITPFAFSEIENARGNETYVIDRKSVMDLYKKDKEFQQIMQTGHFAYVDGHVVHCDSANIIRDFGGSRLSGWANAHIDRVSLRFSRVYSGNHTCTYTFGKMNSEEALKNSFKFLDLNGSMTLREAENAKTQMMEEMPMSFHGALSYIMKGRVTVDELVDRIPISRRTLMRLRTEEKKKYSLDQIIAICIGLNLPSWLSQILLEKAGLSVKRFGPYGYYGTILDCFYMDTINEVQKFLTDNGYDPLNLDFESN